MFRRMHLDEYRKLAAVEDRMWYFHALNRRVIHWIERLGGAGSHRVVDVGCGTGGLIRSIQAAHPEWRCTGLDVEPLACELARERTGVEIVQGSILELPFPDQAFDVVIGADVICQVADSARAVRELARVARPGGVVVVNVPAYRWLWSYHDDQSHTQKRYTRPELVGEFRQAGLTVTVAGYANLPILPLIAARRKLLPAPASGSDLIPHTQPVEWALRTLTTLEFAWQRAGLNSPFGSSVFAAGHRS